MNDYNEPFILLSSIQPNSKGTIICKEESNKQDILKCIKENSDRFNCNYEPEENKIVFENGSEISIIIIPNQSGNIRGERSKFFETCSCRNALNEF